MEKKRSKFQRNLLVKVWVIVMLLFFSSCSGNISGEKGEDGPFDPYDFKKESGKVLENGSSLHYILPEGFEYRYIGDVHPFYDTKSDTWYMFYLDTSGAFNSRLLTSKDTINWKPTKLNIKSGLANYSVLGIVESEERYFSYYAEYIANVSDDLINWSYAGVDYCIPQDKEQFPGGIRDPYVAYDPETKCYYSIGLNYIKRVPSENIYISNLAIGKSIGNSLREWNPKHKKVFAEDLVNHDAECPQLIKIGNRWYIFASIYGRSQHGVGRLSYWIGDENLDPYEVDWTTKKEHHLSTEDLAAAQIVQKDNRFFMFGWIPKNYTGNFWGGHINLATEVYQKPDGTLATKLYDEIAGKIRGGTYYQQEGEKTVSSESYIEIPTLKRMDLQMQFVLKSGQLKLSLQDKKVDIVIKNTEDERSIEVKSNTFFVSKMSLNEDDLREVNDIRIIAEDDIMEIFLNDTSTVQARLGLKLGADRLRITTDSKAVIKKLMGFRLKYREEIK